MLPRAAPSSGNMEVDRDQSRFCLLGTAVSWADYQYANTGRIAAAEIKENYQPLGGGKILV